MPDLEHIDSYPYRHRLAEVMTTPPVVLPPEATLAEAVRRMDAERVSSVIVAQPAAGENGVYPIGIVTERDVLQAVAHDGSEALSVALETIMTSPVASLPPDAFVYRAIGRMTRLGVRHLAVVDASNRLRGVITTRTLLKQRATLSVALGDAVSVAEDAAALRAVVNQLPPLAKSLLDEDMGAREIAAVISGVMRDVSARAADLAAAAMTGEAWGPPPLGYAYLVLGSAGRGESLLAPDQDNALIYADPADATEAEAAERWFAEMGRRASAMLDVAGVPYCTGKVMASERPWRQSVSGWQAQIGHWVASASGKSLLNVDIFYDFVGVAGDPVLAKALRAYAAEAASGNLPFLRFLALHLEDLRPPFGLFGQLRTEGGRIDLKKYALLPLVTGARVVALKRRVDATATMDRLEAAHAAGLVGAHDLAVMRAAHETVLDTLLRQQIAAIDAGKPPNSWVNYGALDRDARAEIRHALRAIDGIHVLVSDVLSGAERPGASQS